jgi:hypothetical protein
MDVTFILAVLRGTPVWVLLLFAYLLVVGLKQLVPSVRDVRRIWIAPILFIVWGLIGLFGHAARAVDVFGWWICGAVSGGMLAMLLAMDLQVDRRRRLVRQPASVLPLLRNLSIFLAHYLLRVAAAIDHASAGRLMNWDIVVSGLSVGYFVIWSIRFMRAYSAAPYADLAANGPAAIAPAH